MYEVKGSVRVMEVIDFAEFFKRFGVKFEAIRTRLNILVVGKAGVGKSTLIDVVFGKRIVNPKAGKLVTNEIESLTDENELYVYETTKIDFNQQQTDEIEKFIKKRQGCGEEERQLHIAWLCIEETNREITNAEKRIYECLKKYGVPTLVVITKAIQDKDENDERFSDKTKGELGGSEVIRVRALESKDEEGEIRKVRWINDFVKKSHEILAPEKKENFGLKQEFDLELKRVILKRIDGRFEKEFLGMHGQKPQEAPNQVKSQTLNHSQIRPQSPVGIRNQNLNHSQIRPQSQNLNHIIRPQNPKPKV
ncbi:MAG: GTPase domain-containing protein [Helicobacter sp.]|uniref:GTPase domain-containing protein n=1 Tax=Helicobacter sp. TaxID=218 RepID=UPI0025C66974|nr:GTPase domain-containing protein [Helicobacter sp.]MCH5313847.1 GTPase domain-containing protein [Helicobacter sp.]